jgi:hypothetical protein
MHHIACHHFDQIYRVIDYKCFELTCWKELEALSDKYRLVSEILENLKASAELKIVLKAALDLGNLATFEYGRYRQKFGNRRDSAFGFTIDSLCRLHEVKSVDGTSNLLIFLTASLAESHPEVLELPKREEYRDLDLMKGWSDRALICEFKLLKEGAGGFLADLAVENEFWAAARKEMTRFSGCLEIVEEEIKEFHNSWQATRIYFGQASKIDAESEDDGDKNVFTDVSHFLTTIWQFFKNFESAVRQVRASENIRSKSSVSFASSSDSA